MIEVTSPDRPARPVLPALHTSHVSHAYMYIYICTVLYLLLVVTDAGNLLDSRGNQILQCAIRSVCPILLQRYLYKLNTIHILKSNNISFYKQKALTMCSVSLLLRNDSKFKSLTFEFRSPWYGRKGI